MKPNSSGKKVAVLISGRGSNLASLIDAAPSSDQDGSYKIIQVISNVAGVAGLDRARAAGIATAVIPHAGKTREAFDAEIDAALRAADAELVVLAGFMRILSDGFVRGWEGKLINIHPSLLPDLRGPCPVFWALAEGRTTSGATVHRIEDARIDAGSILRRAERPIDARKSVAEINTALFLAGAGELGEALEDISSGRAVGPPAAGRYRGFPSGDEVAKARRAGVRLCGLWYAIRLIAAAVLPSYRRSGSGRFRQ